MATSIKDFALSVMSHGISVIPIQSNKIPYSGWKEFQRRLPTPEEINAWSDDVWGIAIVCGSISNRFVFDIDFKAIQDKEEKKQACSLFMENLKTRLAQILPKLYIEITMNAGLHIIVRCTSLEKFPSGSGLLKWNPNDPNFWIETRGEGNCCIVAPSPGYKTTQGNLVDLPDLSITEFHDVMDVMTSISSDVQAALKKDERRREQRETDSSRKFEPKKISSTLEENYGWREWNPTPWDDYNGRTSDEDVLNLLKRHAWTITGSSDKETTLCRPGKHSGTSATFGYYPKTFICFSVSTKFLPERGYSPFQVYSTLEFDGSDEKCIERLIADGYGKKREERFPFDRFTEQEVADYLHGKLAQDVLYTHDEKSWYCWNGKIWEQDNNEAIYEIVRSKIKKLPPLPEEFVDDKVIRKLGKLIDRLETNAGQDAVIDLLKTYRDISRSSIHWAGNPLLLPLKNCTVNLETGPQEHRREDYFSAILPYDFDPSASCPHWERFLSEIQPDGEVREYIKRAMGYILSGFTSEQVLFILYGLGANGKTIFSEILKSLLGGDGVFATNIAPSSLLEIRKNSGDAKPDIAGLKGKRLALSVELPEGRLSEGLVKSLTGSDSIIARRLYQNFQQFTPTHKLILMSNHRPTIRGQDHGIWRRIVLIDFPVQIPVERRRPDHELLSELRAELPGILNWALEGYRQWKRGGLQAPRVILDSIQEYKLENDILQQFFDERLIPDPEGRLGSAFLYQQFNSWQKINGFDYQLNSTTFGRKMKEHGIKQEHTMKGNVWVGYVFKNDSLPESDRSFVQNIINDPVINLDECIDGTNEPMSDNF